MRRTNLLGSRAKGYGWYKKFLEQGNDGFKKNVPPTPFDWSKDNIKRPKAFFDMTSNGENIGKLVFELAEDIVPLTVANFISLCNDKAQNEKFSYKNTKIHMIMKETFIMAGDVENNDGSGSHSAGTTRFFRDENFIIPHSSRGLLSMASVGIDTNGSQFYISLKPTYYMNGRCVVFGRLIEGEEVIKAIEKSFTFRGMPANDLVISSCGILK